ncbi:hypothetical protein [Streptomyces sp. NPDC005141]
MTGPLIDRFAVRWQLAAPELREDAAALLDELLRDALDEALAGMVTADEQVAIASVRVPPVRVSAGRTGEAASAWAQAVASAVAGQLASGGPSVARYPSRSAALLDLTLRACAGDSSLGWAWHQLGLWPTAAGAADATTGATADSVAAALSAEATAVAPVIAAVNRHGELPRLVALLGPTRLERLAAAAWQALGGDPQDVLTAAKAWDTPVARAGSARGERALAPSARSESTGEASTIAEYAASIRSTSPLGAAALAIPDTRVRVALTALALIDTDPGRVGADGAAMLDLALRGPETPEHHQCRRPAPQAVSNTAESPPVVDPPPDSPPGLAAPPRSVVAAPAVTGNAGLLFCLHLAAPLMCPTEPGCALLPEWRGTGSRWALHLLGAELLRRSAPRLPEPDPADPALLAFCGLPPSAPPPGPLSDADAVAARRASAVLADRTVHALRHRLAGRPPARLPQTPLLAHLLHRHGEITASPGWLELRLDLDDVSVDLRAAGLDLDPGWLPALGCIVRFRYA